MLLPLDLAELEPSLVALSPSIHPRNLGGPGGVRSVRSTGRTRAVARRSLSFDPSPHSRRSTPGRPATSPLHPVPVLLRVGGQNLLRQPPPAFTIPHRDPWSRLLRVGGQNLARQPLPSPPYHIGTPGPDCSGWTGRGRFANARLTSPYHIRSPGPDCSGWEG